MESKNHKGFEFLESLPRWEKGHFSPLEVPRQILTSLENPQNDIPTIHLAGTNGKGTTGAFISSILREAGFKVGHFCSPHLNEVAERCLINGKPVFKNKFNDALCEVAESVGWDRWALSYFVATAIASFLCFKREDVDWNVIEAGLGGTYDATNLIEKPRYCVITSISVDHQEVLGESLTEIAENKAGIIKKDSQVLVGGLAPLALEKVKQKTSEVGAFFSELNSIGNCRLSGEILEIDYAGNSLSLSTATEFLKTDYVQRCLMLALRVCHSIGVGSEKIAQGIEKTVWPGRMEQFELSSNCKAILDGAHNLEAFEALFVQIEKIAYRDGIKKVSLVLAMRRRFGFENCVSLIDRKIRKLKGKSIEVEVFCPPWNDSLALTQKEWGELLPGQKINFQSQLELVFNNLAKKDLVPQLAIATGSLHFVGEIRSNFFAAD